MTMRNRVWGFALAALLLAAPGCNDKKSQCRKAADNVEKLLGKDIGEIDGSFLGRCQSHASASVVSCYQRAKNPSDFGACEGGR